MHVRAIIKERARLGLTPLIRGSRIPPDAIGDDDLPFRAVSFLWPWTKRSYPGRHKGFLSSVGRPLTWGAVKHWKAGRNRLPAWAARAMAAQLGERGRMALALEAELLAHADRMDVTPMLVHGRAYPRKPKPE